MVTSNPILWSKKVADSRAKGFLGMQLYVVLTEPVEGMGPVREHFVAHIEYQKEIERKGIMFAAGPFADDKEEFMQGDGMIIIRANSIDEATKIAAADPMHKNGARKFRVRPWLVNEGSLTINVTFSDGGRKIT